MTRVMIAVDASEDSVRAAAAAHELFGDDADYLAVSVADVRVDAASVPWWGPTWGVGWPVAYGAVWSYRQVGAHGDQAAGEPLRTAEDDANDTAEAVVSEAGLSGATTIGELGNPAEAIVRAADEESADVIVVGTHDRGWLDRLLRPSISKGIVERAAIPVLVVH